MCDCRLTSYYATGGFSQSHSKTREKCRSVGVGVSCRGGKRHVSFVEQVLPDGEKFPAGRFGRFGGVGESAGINRLEIENERVLQRKLSQ
jgi:hypothetical protein